MKKKFVSLLLALVICLGLLPVTASAAEASLPDWYFLFAIFKNVDADCNAKNGKAAHAKYSMSQDEVDAAWNSAKQFEAFMNSVGVMRAHVEVVEIEETVTKLNRPDGKASFLNAELSAPLLEKKVDLDRYDHVTCIISLDVSSGLLGITGNSYENGTGHACIYTKNREYCLEQFSSTEMDWPPSTYLHEFMHFMERMSKKWGVPFDFHRIQSEIYPGTFGYSKTCYSDTILNRVKGNAETGTGVYPLAWQYPPHVLRTMTELNVPSGITAIGNNAFRGKSELTRLTIPTSLTSVGYAAFWDTGVTDVYYAGTEAQWKAIQMDKYNKTLTNANIHYNHLMADVKTDDWFAKGVTWAVENGITAGTGGGGFSPNSTCSQAQILTFLWRANGSPEPSGKVSGSEYYAVPLQWAGERGIISGSLDPNSPCTRSDVVTYLWKLAGSPAARAASFSDVPASAGYANAVSWAVEQGITSGTGAGKFSPDSPCTRGQIVTFLRQALAG